ncbi:MULTISPECIES: pilus assembly protein PilP [unclassified Modicisalibacter]|uniref:pilus assembly protein PilP n=1 Tax=unclassified Modicisalibacter TaxID=2679913 RepID=UPI001CCE934A|nr:MULTISPECIES: pilus assembly protein PilP [unclassified Modicisalibacter]MBZ9559418.1 pilus assembly protein PilP [Modicisalibacter sp. R2A 31.J]MBZ9576416.1 pilus assembly protein PilP [Modicisalibacter sp. MOD 31.J]
MTRRLLVGLAVVAALLAGCGDPHLEALDQRLASLRERPSGELPNLPETPDYQPVTYDQAGSRSPFMPERPQAQTQADEGDDLAPDLSRPREALERYPLDALNLVGTLTIDGRHSALIRDPRGEVHAIRVGAHAGTDFGRIVQITNDAVTLVEIVSNGQGGWVERRRSLSLSAGDKSGAGNTAGGQ